VSFFFLFFSQKTNFGVFGVPGKCSRAPYAENGDSGGEMTGSYLVSRPSEFGMICSPKMAVWDSPIGTTSSVSGGLLASANKTGSLNTCSPEIKKVRAISKEKGLQGGNWFFRPNVKRPNRLLLNPGLTRKLIFARLEFKGDCNDLICLFLFFFCRGSEKHLP